MLLITINCFEGGRVGVTSRVCSINSTLCILRMSFNSCPKLERTGAREWEQEERDVFLRPDVKGGLGRDQSPSLSAQVTKRVETVSIATGGGCGPPPAPHSYRSEGQRPQSAQTRCSSSHLPPQRAPSKGGRRVRASGQ